MKREKNYQYIDGSSVCSKCSELFNHQPNVNRHLKICKYKKPSIYKCTCYPKEFQSECHLKKHLKTLESQELKICQKCSKTFKRMDHFLSQKENCTSFASSFVTNDDIPNNDSVLFYDPSSSTIPDTSETIAEVPDFIVPNTSIAEKFDITDLDIDGNVMLRL